MNTTTSITRAELTDLQSRALPVLKLSDPLDPADVIPGTAVLQDPQVGELQTAVDTARRAADGDSDDTALATFATEIQALQDALELALSRWPEITPPE